MSTSAAIRCIALRWVLVAILAPLITLGPTGCRKKPPQPASQQGSAQQESGKQAAQETGSDHKRKRGAGESKQPTATGAISPPDYSAEDVTRVLELRDLAQARLEAGPVLIDHEGQRISSIELAGRLYRQLQELAPHERLPFQNEAVAFVFAFVNANDDQREARRPAAFEASQRLLEHYPLSPDAVLLRVTALMHMPPPSDAVRHRQESIRLLTQAVEKTPDDVRLWFSLYETATLVPPQKALAEKAIARCHELQPDNIAILRRWMFYLAEKQPPNVAEELRKCWEQLRPIILRVQSQLRVSVDALFEKAIADPQHARLNLMQIDNLTKSDDIQKRDLGRVRPNPMDLVIYRFADPRLQPSVTHSKFAPEHWRVAVDGRTLVPAEDVRQVQAEDFDQNGRRDLWVLHGSQLDIFRMDRESGDWQLMTSTKLPPGARGFLIGDLDRDKNFDVKLTSELDPPPEKPKEVVCVIADVDVVVYGDFGVQVYEQVRDAEGKRSLALKEQKLGLENVRNVRRAVFADLDMDYDLDLVVSTNDATTLWLSIGGFRFVDCGQFSQLPTSPLVTMIPVDLDRDADLDIVGVDAEGRVGYLENMLHLRFRWRPLGVDFPKCDDARDLAIVEANGDASWDLLVARESQIELWLTATTPDQFRYTQSVATPGSCSALFAEDWNNDGAVDLVGLGGEQPIFLQGFGDSGFQPWEMPSDSPAVSTPTADAVDLDHDGDVDLLIADAGGIKFFENDVPPDRHWLSVSLRGLDDNAGRVNRNGLGSVVEVKTANGYQARVVNRPTVHFGLGNAPEVDVLRVLWTNGMPQSRIAVAGSVAICEPFELKGSCPFVYPWNGKEFAFYTDCLWAAPLGLQVADGVVAPCREWEYLRIPGDWLQPKDQGYELLLTEELWEAAYFDHVELIAIDHPPDVEVYSNEKVGPADIAQFQVHIVREKRWPKKAVDSAGRDCMALLREMDGEFVQAFPRAIRRGLAPLHYIELDLGELPPDAPVKLFLTGWIFPTDTSLNLAYAQEPELGGPILPYVEVPDSSGKWQTVIPYMGFPGGKTKTIVVDMTGQFLSDDHRVRITTSAEIYWDRVFFTLGKQEADLRLTRLPLEDAQLFYRGFSRPEPTVRHAPRRFDGRQVSHEPKWVPMRGRFTRYGDVRELLAQADDEMVVMGAGDGLRCRFPAPPVPSGLKRDFLLYSVGWDKDADLNTLLGQNSEPLPYRNMGAYPHGLLTTAKDGPARSPLTYRYLTRRQSWNGFWKSLARPAP